MTFTKISGLAAALAGLLLAVGATVGIPSEVNQGAVLAIYVLIPLGIVGIHLRQVGVRPALAWFGFAAGMLVWLVGLGSTVLSMVGVLPSSGGTFGFVSALGLWIGSIVLGATMVVIRVFPLPLGLAISVGAPLAVIGLIAGNAGASAEVVNLLARLGIVVFALGWVGVGVSQFTAHRQAAVPEGAESGA